MNLKSTREIALMNKAGSIVYHALELARRNIRVGVTTSALNEIIEQYILQQKAVPSFKNYNGFPASACISINEEIVHGIPGTRVLKEGDIVSVDIGAILAGYHGDAARTFAVGEVSPEALRLIQVTEECFWKGIAFAKEGNRLGDVSAVIQKTAEDAGFSVVRELVGHGIGTQMHEPPDVPNYGKAGHGLRLKAGLVIAVEPMINIGTRNVRMLDDGWTVVTQDGKYSAHYENTIVITSTEPEILTVD